MLNIQYQPVKLKKYAAKVKQGLVGVIQASATNYEVTFEEQPFLRYNEEDASGLVVRYTLIVFLYIGLGKIMQSV